MMRVFTEALISSLGGTPDAQEKRTTPQPAAHLETLTVIINITFLALVFPLRRS